jgi:hypothetical protein
MSDPTTYYFVLASRKFMLEENPLQESLKERQQNYADRKKAIDFWLVDAPAFLEAPEMAALKKECPQPAAAVISTDPQAVRWLKLRLEFVATGEFIAPTATIPDAIASLVSA